MKWKDSLAIVLTNSCIICFLLSRCPVQAQEKLIPKDTTYTTLRV